MRILIGLSIILGFFGAAGCGQVAANYPQSQATTQKTLPEKYRYRTREYRLVWRVEGVVHGFLGPFQDSSVMVEKMRGFAAAGNSNAAQDEKLFQPMAKEGLAYALIKVFVAKDKGLTINRGDLQITFADESSTADQGVFLYQPAGKGARQASSLNGPVRLDFGDDPGLDGRTMYIFVPSDYLDRTIVSIEM